MAANAMTASKAMKEDAAENIGMQLGLALAQLYVKNEYRPSLAQLSNALTLIYVYSRGNVKYEFKNAGCDFPEDANLSKVIYDCVRSIFFQDMPIYLELSTKRTNSKKSSFINSCEDPDELDAIMQKNTDLCWQNIKLLSGFLNAIKTRKPVTEQIALAQNLCEVMTDLSLEASELALNFFEDLETRIEEITRSASDNEEEKQEKLLALYYLKAIVLSNPSAEGIRDGLEALGTTRCDIDEESLYDKAVKRRQAGAWWQFFNSQQSSTEVFFDDYKEKAARDLMATQQHEQRLGFKYSLD